MSKQRILFTEDEHFGEAVVEFLQLRGFEIKQFETSSSALKGAEEFIPDLLLLDYNLPDGTAADLLPKLKEMHPTAAAIVLTGRGSIELAVQCMQLGADTFLTKPIRLDALHAAIQKVLSSQRDTRNAKSARIKSTSDINPFIGKSKMIRDLEDQARRLLQAQSPILIQGETGSGKGVLAKWLYQNGPRSQEPFVDLNCAGLGRELLESELFGHEKGAFTSAAGPKEGLFEVAHKGTIFLDEIGDVDPAVQPKLLKAVEEKKFRRLGDTRERHVDIHLISASHHDLRSRVDEGKFREDLFYRIGALPLRVPPLRERSGDIPEIAQMLLQRIAYEVGRPDAVLTDEALTALQKYSWPGNIREMRNVLERAVLLSSSPEISIDLGLLQAEYATSTSAGGSLQGAEREEIARVLKDTRGNISAAAKSLGISRSGLYLKIKEYNLRVENEQPV